MATIESRLGAVEEQVRNLRDDIAELARSIDGPNGNSLRTRVHKLESDVAAARIAAETLAAYRREKGDGFTKKQQVAVLLFGAIASLGTMASMAVAISQLGG